MTTDIIIRRGERGGTTAELAAANEILLEDEICVELNVAGKRLLKVGDGVTHWVDLPYITADLTAPAHAVDVTFTPAGSIGATNVQAALAEVDGDVTGLAGSKVDKATLDAQSVLGAVVDNTPVAIVLGASQLLGRKATGNVGPITVSEALALLAVYSSTQTDTAISTQINALVGGAPGLLDTLKELADALGDDPNFAATITAALATKAADNAVVKLTGDQTVDGIKKMLKRPLTSEFAAWSSIPVNNTAASTAIGVLDAAPGDLKSLVVRPGETILIDTTIAPATLDWEVKRGGMIKVAAGQTFTPRSIKAGAYKIFDLSATGSHVVFGAIQERPFVEWFGALPDGATAVSGRAFNDGIYAIKNSAAGGGALHSTAALEGREFIAEEMIVRKSGVSLPGLGQGLSNIKQAPGSNLLAVVSGENFLTLTHQSLWTGALTKCSMNGWTLDGNKDNQTALPVITSAPFNVPFGGANPTTIDVDHLEYIVPIPMGGGVFAAFMNTLSGPTFFTYTGMTGSTGAGSLTGCAGGSGRVINNSHIFTHGFGLAVFSYDTYDSDLIMRNCRAAGWWTEGGSGVIDASPPTPLASLSNEPTCRYRNIKSHDNDFYGIIHRGPTDATFDAIEAFRNGSRYGGYVNGGFATAKVGNSHMWGWPQKYSWEIHSFVDAVNCIAEVNSQANSRGLIAFCPFNWEGSFFASTPGVGGLIAIELASATQCKGAVIRARVKDCINGAIKYTAEAGPNYAELYVDDATGTAVVVGTPVAGSIFNIIPIGNSTFKPFTNRPGNWVDKSAAYQFLTGVEGGRFTGTFDVTGAAIPQPNRIYWVCNVGTGIITYKPASGLVGTGAAYQVNPGQRVGFVFDGTNTIAI